MNNQSHYLIPGSEKSNFADETVPIRVNCAGYCMRLKPFSTEEPLGRNDYYLQYITEDELTIKIDGKEKKYPKGKYNELFANVFALFADLSFSAYKLPKTRSQLIRPSKPLIYVLKFSRISIYYN